VSRARAMRRALDNLYDAAAWLAALLMVALLLMVLTGIASREFGFHVPGTDAYAGYLMAGAGFLALAHTFRRGEHIRVTLLLHALPARARHAFELWSLAAATCLAALIAFYSARLAWQSRVFNDISTASDATPLWIPQIGMALGTLIFFVALLDAFVGALRGGAVGSAATAASTAQTLRNDSGR
jgi:TRAP-type C4-dicarboxylate transport system permease small subunit